MVALLVVYWAWFIPCSFSDSWLQFWEGIHAWPPSEMTQSWISPPSVIHVWVAVDGFGICRQWFAWP
jgi:hypothetical protein